MAVSTSGTSERQEALRLEALRESGLLADEHFAHFDRLTELATRLIGAPVALVSMVDADRQYFTSHHGLSDAVAVERSTPLAQSVCASVVADNAPLVISSMGGDEQFADHPARADLGVEAYCGVPIRDRNGFVLGSFCIIDDHDREWDQNAVELLQGFAHLVGDYVQTRHDHLELVTTLQQRILPAARPAFDFGDVTGAYRPVQYTEDVGGDFYDWHVRPDGTLDIIIGDVVGHGLGSTQAAAQLRSAARAVFTGSTRSPALAVRRLADACAPLPGCACAAITIVHISADGGVVEWSRAGSPPPLHLAAGAGRVVHGSVGAPLGVGTSAEADVNRLELGIGESVVFFTDGLVERRDELIDDGFARAAQAAVSNAGIDGFIDAVCPPATQGDDIAVVRFTRR